MDCNNRGLYPTFVVMISPFFHTTPHTHKLLPQQQSWKRRLIIIKDHHYQGTHTCHHSIVYQQWDDPLLVHHCSHKEYIMNGVTIGHFVLKSMVGFTPWWRLVPQFSYIFVIYGSLVITSWIGVPYGRRQTDTELLQLRRSVVWTTFHLDTINRSDTTKTTTVYQSHPILDMRMVR